MNMDTFKLVVAVVQLMASLFLIGVVLLQSGKRSGLSGAIAGAADTFLAKNRARTWDAKLARMTKWVAILFILLTVTLNCVR
jgi:preprotein translocase subunit SecG